MRRLRDHEERAGIATQAKTRSLYRRRDDRMVAGVAAGVADALGIDPAYARAGFVALFAASGLGAVVYAALWIATARHEVDATARHTTPVLAASVSERRRTVGAGLVYVSVLLILSETGLWLGASSGAVALTAFGVATVWARSDTDQRSRWTNALLRGEGGDQTRRELLIRAAAGGLLIIVGLTVFFTTSNALRSVGSVLLAALITGVGVLLVLGPYVVRLTTELRAARRDQIRAEEREEVAAHLHDSVLQTLALIQRTKDPEQQAILARIQERELRDWLFGGERAQSATLARAIEQVAAAVERDHQVAIDVVTVGDHDLDPGLEALVAAAREAMVNSAKHSGARSLSVYAEVADEHIDVFITDQGIGFRADAIDGDRHGIRDSIIARMERHGGTAEITSDPGDGTEVHLHLTRRAP